MVSIIILTYNSEQHIESLLKSLPLSKDIEIIVVDNNSTDGTIAKISNFQFPISNFKLIKNEINYGFAKGINIGAKNSKGEYLLFLNPDTEFISGNLDEFVRLFKENEKVGVIGGKIVDKNGRVEQSAGKFFGIMNASTVALGLDEKLGVRFSPSKPTKVDFVSGGFMMVRKSLFQKLGGFDEDYFMYVEDMDFCYRANLAGFDTYFDPEVVIEHESHGSSNRGFAIKHIYKGIFKFHKKHGTSFSYFVVKSLFLSKATALVILGKITNNKKLSNTYFEALKA